MTRLVSVIVLGLLVLLFAALFFQVMIGFVLPMFLAVIFAVVFRPLHKWFIRRSRGHDRIAAAVTTLTIVLIVLAPLLGVLVQATDEAVNMVRNPDGPKLDRDRFATVVDNINRHLGTELSVDEIQSTFEARVVELREPLAIKSTQILVQFVIGVVVMILSLYYFLADGPLMIDAVLRLLPLEHHYEQQLVAEFETLSRAVVLATLLTSIAQGILATIGFYFAGLGSLMLLALLTMIGSMIPFVGAATVWGSCCLWLLLVEGRVLAAVLLAVYGIVIISTTDYVIKTLVLHGKSNLHPLLALLSVLGGVQALGPIGIFVGPMAVAFLQAGLNMLHAELGTLEQPAAPINKIIL